MANGRSGAVAQAPSGKTWDDFVKCEVDHDDTHEVHPRTWPPPRIGNTAGEPSMALPCVRCHTNCIVYAGHATGELKGVTVIVPEKKKSA